MSGYARIIHSPYSVYVSFRGVGDKKKFEFLMDRFNSSFPVKVWDEQRRAWQLAPSDLPKILDFSKAVFGRQGYILQNENIISDSDSQSSLI